MQRSKRQNKEIWKLTLGPLARLTWNPHIVRWKDGHQNAIDLMRDKVEEIKAREIANGKLQITNENELRSTRSLTHEQANELIVELGKMIEKLKQKVEFSDGEGSITSELVYFMYKLAKDAGFDDNPEASIEVRVRGFCESVIKKDWPGDRFEINQVIEALKGMVTRRNKKGKLLDRIAQIDRKRLTPYEENFLINIVDELNKTGKLHRPGAVRKLEEIWRKRRVKRQKAKCKI